MRTLHHRGLLVVVLVSVSGLGLAACKGSADNPAGEDLGSAHDASVHPSDGASHRQRVFVTQKRYRGDLSNGGGLAGGDAACAAAAQAAQLPGSFKAWLSTSTVNAIDRIADAGPWYDLADAKVFENRASLAAPPLMGLWRDEKGQFLASDEIWTGTRFDGTFDTLDRACMDWTTAGMGEGAKVGQVGRSDGAAWTAFTSTTCDQQAHLICFAQ